LSLQFIGRKLGEMIISMLYYSDSYCEKLISGLLWQLLFYLLVILLKVIFLLYPIIAVQRHCTIFKNRGQFKFHTSMDPMKTFFFKFHTSMDPMKTFF